MTNDKLARRKKYDLQIGNINIFRENLVINYKSGISGKKCSPVFLRDAEELKNVRFEVFTAVTVKNGVFWDIKIQCLPHMRHITSPLQRPAG
jgi:hypothetical protein